MGNIQLPENNKVINKILFAWFGGWAGYLEYQKSKKIADAMADNEAMKIKMAGEIEEKIIRERFCLIERLEQADRIMEYKNLYDVLTKTAPRIEYSGDELNNINPDKLKRLKTLSKEFSDSEMQDYVSQILAGEINKPGTYSTQTISTIQNLGTNEMALFKRFCGLVVDGDFIFGSFFALGHKNNKLLSESGVSYEDYIYLQELGLVTNNNVSRTLSVPGEYSISIGKKNVRVYIKNPLTITGLNLLTRAGKELFNLIGEVYTETLFNITKEEILRQGFLESDKI